MNLYSMLSVRIFLLFFLLFFLSACNRFADQINAIKARNINNVESTQQNTDEKNTFFKSVCKEIGEKIRCTQKHNFDTHDGKPLCLESYWSWDNAESVDEGKGVEVKGSVEFNQFTSIDTQKEARQITIEKREKFQHADYRTKESFEKIKKEYISLAHKLKELISKNEYPECKTIVEKELAEGL